MRQDLPEPPAGPPPGGPSRRVTAAFLILIGLLTALLIWRGGRLALAGSQAGSSARIVALAGQCRRLLAQREAALQDQLAAPGAGPLERYRAAGDLLPAALEEMQRLGGGDRESLDLLDGIVPLRDRWEAWAARRLAAGRKRALEGGVEADAEAAGLMRRMHDDLDALMAGQEASLEARSRRIVREAWLFAAGAAALVLGLGAFSFWYGRRIAATSRRYGLALEETRRREQELVRSQARMRRLTESDIIGIIHSDLTGRILYANDCFLRMVGYEAADLGTLSWKELTPPEHQAASERAVEELVRKGYCSPIAKEYLHRSGRRVPALVGPILTDAAAGECLTYVVDLTETKNAEIARRRSDSIFHRLSEADVIGIVEFGSDGVLTAANDAFLKMVGAGRHDVEERRLIWSDLAGLPPGPAGPVERDLARPDGGTVPVLIRTAPVESGRDECVGLALDLTQHRRAQREARLLSSVSIAVAAAEGLESALEVALRLIGETTGWSFGRAWVPAAGSRELAVCAAWHGEDPRLEWLARCGAETRLAPGEGPAGRCFGTGRVVSAPDMAAEPALSSDPLLSAAGLRSVAAFPVASGEDLIGVIEFFGFETAEVDARRIDLVTSVAAGIGSILGRRRAEDLAHTYARRLELLRDLDLAILSARSSEEIARRILEGIGALLPHDGAAVLTVEPGGGASRVLTSAGSLRAGLKPGDRSPDGSLGALVDPGEAPDRAPEESDGSRLPAPAGLEEPPLRRMIPLRAEGVLIGALVVEWSRSARPSDEALGVLHEVATPLAIALRQASLRELVERHAEDLERKVASRTRELEQRNAEMKTFTYTISHDLRTPLRAMQGFGDALLEDCAGQLGSAGRDYAQRIVKAARRMDDLIRELLEYSRLERRSMPLTEVPLSRVVADVIAHLGPDIEASGAEITVEEPLPAVVAHEPTLGQILQNLVTNAMKFVARGARPIVRIRAEEEGGLVRVCVQDQGIGIAPGNLERIFGVFERLHGIETYPGMGIGLATVRKGTERMGGRVRVESRPGAGSRFWVELPSAAGRTQDVGEAGARF